MCEKACNNLDQLNLRFPVEARRTRPNMIFFSRNESAKYDLVSGDVSLLFN